MRRQSDYRVQGFSLVELLVALVFTLVLMAGMAGVFQGSLGTFVTSGEKLSSARRNRMSVDMIYDDLNAAGMLLTSLENYGGTSVNPIVPNSLNPPFRITPNVPYAGTDVAAPNNVTDQLDLFFDEALPFEGTITTAVQAVVEMVPGTPVPNTQSFTIQLGSDQQAAELAAENAVRPIAVMPRANISQPQKPTSITPSGSTATISLATSFTSETEDISALRLPLGTGVMFVKPHRYIRYSIRPINLDPDPAAAGAQIPCLVRDEAVYDTVSGSATPFAAPLSTTIIAENVIGFQVMISSDGGLTWINDPNDAGQRSGGVPNAATPGLSHTIHTSWSNLRDRLNVSPGIASRPAPNNSVSDSRFWFKDIPVTIRVDITTRTARPRAEYQQSLPNTIIKSTIDGPPYKIQTQSIVLVPRHFGLSYGSGLL